MRMSLPEGLLVAVEGAVAMLLYQFVPLRGLEVLAHHLGHQLGKLDLGLPAELAPRLGRISEQSFDLGRTEIARIDPDDLLPRQGAAAGSRIHDADLLAPAAAPR